MTVYNRIVISSGVLLAFLINLANGYRCERKRFGISYDFSCPQERDPSDAVFCCGTKYNRYCCASREIIDIGMLIGTVMAGFFLIVCAILAVCCCIRRRNSQGLVTTSAYTVPSSATIVTSTPSYPAAPYGSPPPGYTMPVQSYQNAYPAAPYPNYPTQGPAQYPQQAMPYKDAPPTYPGY